MVAHNGWMEWVTGRTPSQQLCPMACICQVAHSWADWTSTHFANYGPRHNNKGGGGGGGGGGPKRSTYKKHQGEMAD